MKYWIYWPEQCKYCLNRHDCEYETKVKEYIQLLQDVPDKGCYGSLAWWCDYFITDEKKYLAENPGECCV